MNAVEAAEQLMQVGHRMQALEQHLRMPVVALRVETKWRELLVDPSARLAALLTTQDRPQPAAQSPDPARPSAPFQWQTEPTPAAPSAAHWESALEQLSVAQATTPATNADLSPAVPIANRAQQPSASSTSSAPSVRLTRDQTSLLSILNANVRPDGHTRPALERTPIGSSPSSLVMQAATLPQPGARLTDSTARPQSNTPENTRRLPQGETQHSEVNAPAHTATASRQNSQIADERDEPIQPALDAPGLFSTKPPASTPKGVWSTDAAASVNRQPEGHPLRDAEPIGAAQHPHSAPTDADGATTWRARPSTTDDQIIWPAATSVAAPLSSAQIDQLLDALDERLELLLLRMYGTTNG